MKLSIESVLFLGFGILLYAAYLIDNIDQLGFLAVTLIFSSIFIVGFLAGLFTKIK